MASTTSVAVDTVVWAWNRFAPPGWQRPRDVAIGAVYQAEDIANRVAAAVRSRAGELGADAAQRLQYLVDDLADIGSYEARLAERRAAAYLQRVVQPLVATAVDDVLIAREAREEESAREALEDETLEDDSLEDDLLDAVGTGLR
jgi:hypothetical protein